jgi:hypothetical protein
MNELLEFNDNLISLPKIQKKITKKKVPIIWLKFYNFAITFEKCFILNIWQEFTEPTRLL